MSNIPASLSGWASVRYVEVDNSSIVSADSSLTFGALLSASNGPVLDVIQLSDATTQAGLFGEPTSLNRTEWQNIARVFKYKSGLIGGTANMVRVIGENSLNQALAVTITEVINQTDLTTMLIRNETEAENPTVVFDTHTVANTGDDTVAKLKFFSKYPTTDVYKIALTNATDFATADIVDGVSFLNNFDDAPTGTELAIAILDSDNDILEKHIVDMTDGNLNDEGVSNYIETVINENSAYLLVYSNASVIGVPISFEGTALTKGVNVAPIKADYIEGLALFEDFQTVNIHYFLGNNICIPEMISLCHNRLDCQLIWSAPLSTVVGKDNITATSNLVTYAGTTVNTTSTYSEFFGNAIMFYDKYAARNVWGEVAGDMVGLRILKNLTGNPWEASAGLNYGQLREVVKLAVNFKPAQQITLQKNKVNPVVNKPGKGLVSWGIQNYTTKKSALLDSTVRGLLVTIWRAARESLEWDLFEINDQLTRSQIQSKLESFMANIQSNRGVTEFVVTCDTTNNTPQIIDQNQMVVTIRLIPTRIAKEIILQTVLERTGADLSETF